MEIKNIIFHQIIKEIKSTTSELNLSQDVINIDVDVKDFALRLIKSFNQKYPTQGTFEKDEDIFPFQKFVQHHIDAKYDFVKFTQKSMLILKKNISIHSTTGGYVVFLSYLHNKQDFLITIMLDKSEQFTVHDENLGIEKLKTLDIDKIARGSRLNISKWKNDNSLYLSFIKGTRAISNYFVQFIGATDITSSKENIRKLYDCVNEYLLTTQLSQNQKEVIKEKLSDYFTECHLGEGLVELKSISAIIFPKNPLSFTNYLVDIESDVSDNIKIVSPNDFNVFKGGKIKGDGFELSYDRKLIKSKKIVAKDGKITISDVSQEIINEINNGR